MAGVGVLHFVFGRYCNYSANQVAGVNLTAPVVQLQVLVTLVLAVVILHEPCTALQMIGGALILAGSLITQRQPQPRGAAPTQAPPLRAALSQGYVFASLAALAYGTSPIMARFALEAHRPGDRHPGRIDRLRRGDGGGRAGAVLAAGPARRLCAEAGERCRWFACSGVFVAMAQGFFFAAVAVAPIMLVMPLLQLSLVFRLMFSTWLNPDHEVFGPIVLSRRRDLGRRLAHRLDRHRIHPARAERSRSARPGAALAGLSAPAYSGFIPAAATVLATRSLSLLSNARYSLGPRPAGSMPVAANCLMVSASLTIAATSSAIFSRAAGGVPVRA